MKKFVLVDLNDTEIFESEEAARARLAEWVEYAKDLSVDSMKYADRETIDRWKREQAYYKDELDEEIRIYAIDTDVYDGAIRYLDFVGADGVECIERVGTTVEDLGLEWPDFSGENEG